MRTSKFTLAFENSRARDYVTEKFFWPIDAGSIPIAYGAPNVALFAPGGPNSAIDAYEYTYVPERNIWENMSGIREDLRKRARITLHAVRRSLGRQSIPHISCRPEELGKLLRKISRNETAFLEYHAWRKQYGSPEYRALAHMQVSVDSLYDFLRWFWETWPNGPLLGLANDMSVSDHLWPNVTVLVPFLRFRTQTSLVRGRIGSE